MTDNEVIKGLECCKNDDCDNCPNTFGNCYSNLAGAALDLINRQQTEIDRLSVYNEEIVNRIRKSAIKEFEDKLKEKAVDVGICDAQGNSFGGATVVFVGDIDNLVKEMGCGKQ